MPKSEAPFKEGASYLSMHSYNEKIEKTVMCCVFLWSMGHRYNWKTEHAIKEVDY